MKQVAGDDAEARAAIHLERLGCVVVGRNVKLAFGELDLIVKDGDVVVFVEVRKRKTRVEALESVGPKKQVRLIRAATMWLEQNAPAAKARFDVVAVTRLDVHHVRDAFSS
ncbi:MAG: YraN family protein [Deltaproteobacteria bacterium]|nr:YraN family protein [Deltaproteobacteria bacterium]